MTEEKRERLKAYVMAASINTPSRTKAWLDWLATLPGEEQEKEIDRAVFGRGAGTPAEGITCPKCGQEGEVAMLQGPPGTVAYIAKCGCVCSERHALPAEAYLDWERRIYS